MATFTFAVALALSVVPARAADHSHVEAALLTPEAQASIWRAERFPRKSPEALALAVENVAGPSEGDAVPGRMLVIAQGGGRWGRECPSCSSSGTVKTVGVFAEGAKTFRALFMERDDCPLAAAFLRARRGAPDLVEVDRVECQDFGKPRYLEYYSLSSTGAYRRELQIPLSERVTADGDESSIDYTDAATFKWTDPDVAGDRALIVDTRRRVDHASGSRTKEPAYIGRVYRWTGDRLHLSEQTEDALVVLDPATGLRLHKVDILREQAASVSGPGLGALFDDPNARVREAARHAIFSQLYAQKQAGQPIAHPVFALIFERLRGTDDERARDALMSLRALGIYPVYTQAEREILLSYARRKGEDWDALLLLASQRVPEVLPIARKQLESALDSSDGCAAERAASLLSPYLDYPQSWMPGLLKRAKSSTLTCDDGYHGPNPISHQFDNLLKKISK